MQSIFMIFLVSCCTLASQLILKKEIVDITGQLKEWSFNTIFFIHVFKSPVIWFSFILQGASYCLWMYVLSKYKLGFVIGLSGAFLYIMLPLFGWLLFGERLTYLQWLGLVLISAGVFFMLAR